MTTMRRETFPNHVLDVASLGMPSVARLLAAADGFVDRRPRDALRGLVVASLFFQPSTRTRIGFETAALRLGAGVTGFADPNMSRCQKATEETFEDCIHAVGAMADAIVLRHSDKGMARHAASLVGVPVVNAGDGDEHPTQALIDVFAMTRLTERPVDDLRVGLTGDLGNRCTRPLVRLLAGLGVREVAILTEEGRPVDAAVVSTLAESGVPFRTTGDLLDLLSSCDAVSAAPRDTTFISDAGRSYPADITTTPESHVISADKIARTRSRAKILHPLPRRNEISTDVDALPNAGYFRQMELAVPVRMAVLEHVLAVSADD